MKKISIAVFALVLLVAASQVYACPLHEGKAKTEGTTTATAE